MLFYITGSAFLDSTCQLTRPKVYRFGLRDKQKETKEKKRKEKKIKEKREKKEKRKEKKE